MDDTIRSELSYAIREVSGMGLREVASIMKDAEDNLDDDYVLATMVRHAHGFAISVKVRNPSHTPEQARRKWDLEWARRSRSTAGPEWAEVERLSAEMTARR